MAVRARRVVRSGPHRRDVHRRGRRGRDRQRHRLRPGRRRCGPRTPAGRSGSRDRLRHGTIWINDYHPYVPQAEWGGFKRSGIGRELGPTGLDEYRETKHIWHNIDPRPQYWFPATTQPSDPEAAVTATAPTTTNSPGSATSRNSTARSGKFSSFAAGLQLHLDPDRRLPAVRLRLRLSAARRSGGRGRSCSSASSSSRCASPSWPASTRSPAASTSGPSRSPGRSRRGWPAGSSSSVRSSPSPPSRSPTR